MRWGERNYDLSKVEGEKVGRGVVGVREKGEKVGV